MGLLRLAPIGVALLALLTLVAYLIACIALIPRVRQVARSDSAKRSQLRFGLGAGTLVTLYLVTAIASGLLMANLIQISMTNSLGETFGWYDNTPDGPKLRPEYVPVMQAFEREVVLRQIFPLPCYQGAKTCVLADRWDVSANDSILRPVEVVTSLIGGFITWWLAGRFTRPEPVVKRVDNLTPSGAG